MDYSTMTGHVKFVLILSVTKNSHGIDQEGISVPADYREKLQDWLVFYSTTECVKYSQVLMPALFASWPFECQSPTNAFPRRLISIAAKLRLCR